MMYTKECKENVNKYHPTSKKAYTLLWDAELVWLLIILFNTIDKLVSMQMDILFVDFAPKYNIFYFQHFIYTLY